MRAYRKAYSTPAGVLRGDSKKPDPDRDQKNQDKTKKTRTNSSSCNWLEATEATAGQKPA